MRRFSSNRFSVGLENEQLEAEEQEVAEAGVDGDGAAGAETLETDLIEVNDSASEGTDREDSIDDAVDAVDELSEDVETLEAAQESGGINEYAAAILTRKVNLRLASLGMPELRVPATESFGTYSTRQGATQVAIEGIKESIANIWKAIISAITNSIKWIRDFFTKFFGAQEKLLKRAKALKERAKDTKGTIESGDIEKASLARALAANGEVSLDKVKFFNEEIKGLLSNLKGLSNKLNGIISKLNSLESAQTVGEDVKATVESLFARLNVTDSKEEKSGDSDKEVKIIPDLPGNRFVEFTTSAKNPEENGVRVANGEGKNEVEKLKTLSLNECQSLTEAIEGIATTMVDMRKEFDNVAKVKEDLVKAAKKLSKDAEGDAKDKAKTALKVVKGLNKLLGQAQKDLLAYSINVLKSELDWVELSLKRAKEK